MQAYKVKEIRPSNSIVGARLRPQSHQYLHYKHGGGGASRTLPSTRALVLVGTLPRKSIVGHGV